MSGFIAYEGPSMLDGAPIVVIVTHGSQNRKTGALVQTWILRADVSPVDASRSGADESICGQCPHRHFLKGSCYVNIGQAPGSVWRAYKRGSYARADAAALQSLAGSTLRLGSYGDPAAVPLSVWDSLAVVAAATVGYTHQWRECDAGYARYCMASVDSVAEQDVARAMGYRTFRVRSDATASLSAREFVCPASTEAGNVKTCATCGACDGSRGRNDKRASVAIVVHGALAKRFQPA